jgi:hypothetical protein
MQSNPIEIDRATTYYQQAFTLAVELAMRPLQAHCHHGFGILYGETGQAAQAHAEWTTAIELYRGMGMTCWLRQAQAK